VRKFLIALAVIPVIIWSLWLAFPKKTVQSILEDAAANSLLDVRVEDLRKGLFFNFSIGKILLSGAGREMASFDYIRGHIKPLHLLTLQLRLSFDGTAGRGTVHGNMQLTKKRMQAKMDIVKAGINELPFLQLIGIRGDGTISGSFSMINDRGRLDFQTEDAQFKQASVSGIMVPLQFFHAVRGSAEIAGNRIDIVSVSFEGKDIHARLKGFIENGNMNLTMELMPGKTFLENPFMLAEIEKYRISPGYYVIPISGSLPG
jgi:type II secretion system protein N